VTIAIAVVAVAIGGATVGAKAAGLVPALV